MTCPPPRSNRSLAHLEAGAPEDALRDALSATTLRPDNVKGWYRKARLLYVISLPLFARNAEADAAIAGGRARRCWRWGAGAPPSWRCGRRLRLRLATPM